MPYIRTYSIVEIAAHLAKIGALIINAALPFLILIAILAGAVILTFAIGGTICFINIRY